MQKIDIDDIIIKLKKTNEWKKFYDYLIINKLKFNYQVDYFLWKDIILDLVKSVPINTLSINEKWIYNRYNNWQLNNEDIIKPIKDKFIEIFIDKVKFCPICWKVPLVVFNSWLQKDKSFLINELFQYLNIKIEDGRLFDLDHFFPKDKYKYLAINFYNLIPICKWCNYLKNNSDPLTVNKNQIFHPYFWFLDNLNANETFDTKFSFVDNSLLLSEHSKFFKLLEIYLNSQDTKNDIQFILHKINQIKANSKSKIPPNIEGQKEKFFKYFYPKYENNILMYSNWKLRKDWINNITNYI